MASDARTLPGGPLREPPDAIVAADAVLAADDEVAHALPAPDGPVQFGLRRSLGAPVAESGAVPSGAVLAVAGIAHTDRFFDDLLAAGCDLAARMVFRDHHPYSSRDVSRIWAEAAHAEAVAVVTTEKDYVRLLPFRPFPLPVVYPAAYNGA